MQQEEEFPLKIMEFFQESEEFSEPHVGDVSLGVWGGDTGSTPASPMSFLQDSLSQNSFSMLFFSLRSIYQATNPFDFCQRSWNSLLVAGGEEQLVSPQG